MDKSKTSEEIVPQVDMSHFLGEALERAAARVVSRTTDKTTESLDIADKASLQAFALRRQGSARDWIKEAQDALEKAVLDMAEARMAFWLLARRENFTGRKECK